MHTINGLIAITDFSSCQSDFYILSLDVLYNYICYLENYLQPFSSQFENLPSALIYMKTIFMVLCFNFHFTLLIRMIPRCMLNLENPLKYSPPFNREKDRGKNMINSSDMTPSLPKETRWQQMLMLSVHRMYLSSFRFLNSESHSSEM